MAKKNQKQTVPDGGNAGVDLHEVERLLAFMEKRGLEEFEYERDGVRVRLRRASAHVQGGPRSMATAENAVNGAPEGSRATAPGEPALVRESAADTAAAANLHVVKSPIVGTFYSSATPAGDPFVSVGSRVESGQALCIIEAMKLMNEIEADVAGEIVKIFVENGQPVEYGEPLFGINPRKK